jgi:GNAT superfamily N-acetyltransferase
MAEFYFLTDEKTKALFQEYEKIIEKLLGLKVLISYSDGTDITTAAEGQHNGSGFYQVRAFAGELLLKTVAGWRMKEMPGCCGICIATGAYVMPDFRGKGIGGVLNKLRIKIATELKYGLLLCTDRVENEPQQKILTKNGWSEIKRFLNPKTHNEIGVHCIKL